VDTQGVLSEDGTPKVEGARGNGFSDVEVTSKTGTAKVDKLKVDEPNDREKRFIRKTERAKAYHYKREKDDCARLLRRLLRQEKLLTLLMESDDNKEKVMHDSNEYDKTFSELIGAYTRFIELIENEEEEESARKSLNELDATVFNFKEKIYTWMATAKDPSVCPSRSSGRRSQKSASVKTYKTARKSPSKLSASHLNPQPTSSKHSSSGSSMSSRSSVASNSSRKSYLEHKAEAAGLRAEASMLKRKREAELEAELLELEQKIQRAEAMGQVYADELEVESLRDSEEEYSNNEGEKKRKREKRRKFAEERQRESKGGTGRKQIARGKLKGSGSDRWKTEKTRQRREARAVLTSLCWRCCSSKVLLKLP
jgi:hypothetical protein